MPIVLGFLVETGVWPQAGGTNLARSDFSLDAHIRNSLTVLTVAELHGALNTKSIFLFLSRSLYVVSVFSAPLLI